MRNLYRKGLKVLSLVYEADIPAALQNRRNTMMFLMPFAHGICDSNKSRCLIGFLTGDDFAPGKIPDETSWLMPADFDDDDDDAREEQAAELSQRNIVSVFLRFESGHSANIRSEHPPFRPEDFPDNYLVHGTNERNLQSIRRRGLMPGGTRGGRNHVHFALDFLLTTVVDALRPESDCILIIKPDDLSDLEPVKTRNNYVLTTHTVPFDRFCGVWSIIDRAWIEIPNDDELSKMNQYIQQMLKFLCTLLNINFIGINFKKIWNKMLPGNDLIIFIMLLASSVIP